MAQPTLSGLTLNAGSGGSDLLHDVVSSKIAQVELVAYSTGDGTLNVVMADTGFPVVSETGATWAVTQSGTWNITNISGTISLPTGAATEATLADIKTAVQLIDDAVAADGQAYGKGVLIQGDDGTDRRALLVDAAGHPQIDVLTMPATAAPAASLPGVVMVLGADDGMSNVEQLYTDGSGNLRVKVNTALPAGTNAIGKLAANDGVDIGDVDVTSMPSDTFVAEGGALGKGVLLQGDDGTDRTNVLVDTAGHVQVDVLSCASHAVTNAGTFAVQVDGDALTALQLIDDTVAVLGTATYAEATTKGNVVGAVRNDDLAALANTDNEIAPLQVNSAGALYTEPAQQVDYVFDASAKCTIKRKSGICASGTTAILSAVASKKFRILAFAAFATSATATNIYLSTTTDTDVLGDSSNPIPLATDADGDNVAGFVLPWNPGGWTETSTANEALNLTLSAAQDVIYCITYIEVA